MAVTEINAQPTLLKAEVNGAPTEVAAEHVAIVASENGAIVPLAPFSDDGAQVVNFAAVLEPTRLVNHLSFVPRQTIALDRSALDAVRAVAGDDPVVRRILEKHSGPTVADQRALGQLYWEHVAEHPELARAIHPARGRSEAETARLTEQMLEYIQTEARRRAAEPRRVDPSSKFVQRLEQHYLAEYLDNPNPETGRAAIARIAAPFEGPPRDAWERLGSNFNAESIPDTFKKLRPGLPDQVAAATDVISIANQSILPYVDVPHLLGDLNPSRDIDTEVDYQGRNISDLLHWATGVKYHEIDAEIMRELFVAYEEWHLEQWDVFAEDPVNDIIVEDQGRILGQQLANAEITRANLLDKLNEGFNEARAWVGSVLKIVQNDLDAQITSPEPAETELYFASGKQYPYGRTSFHEQLALGWDVETVKGWAITDKYIELYALIYEAESWQREHSSFGNSRLLHALVRGELDHVLAAAHGNREELDRMEQLGVLLKIIDFRMVRDALVGGRED